MAGSNWQQLAGGSVNPYDVLRDDGTPTADYGQHVICDGGTVTLPSPQANEAVLVSNISQYTTVTTSTGLVEKRSDVTHPPTATDPVLFVSDGSDWYVANNLDYIGTIPDSVVTQFDPETFTTGDTTWGDDVGGDEDMSLTGDPQKVTLSNGNPGVKGDGTDDYGLFPFPLSGTALQSFAIEFAYESTSTGENALLSVIDGNQEITIFHNLNENFNTDDGNLFVKIKDTDGNQIQFSSSAADLNDGNRHTIVWNINDSTTNDVELLIDGSSVSLSFSSQENPDNFGAWSYDMGFWARNNGGSIDSNSQWAAGLTRIHDSPIDNPTI